MYICIFLDIETIDISRFNEKCSICQKTGYGPCMKCDNDKCQIYFHVECARINKYHMECILADEGMKYFLYCQTHRPLQFLKTLEIKNSKKKEDIMKFAELVEKTLENLTKQNQKISLLTKPYALEKCSANNLKYLNKKRTKLCQTDINEVPELSKNQLNKVISRVKDVYHKISNLDVMVKYREKAKKYEVLKEFTNFVSFKDTFDKNIFPWYLINIPGIPIKLAYVNYGRLCNNNTEFNKLILCKNSDKSTHPVNLTTNTTSLYCYCKNKYDESFMVACSNEANCKYNGWFHPLCVDELKHYTKEEVENDNFVFTCKSCLKQKNGEEESKTDYYSKQFKKSSRVPRRVKLTEQVNTIQETNELNNNCLVEDIVKDSNKEVNTVRPFEISFDSINQITSHNQNIKIQYENQNENEAVKVNNNKELQLNDENLLAKMNTLHNNNLNETKFPEENNSINSNTNIISVKEPENTSKLIKKESLLSFIHRYTKEDDENKRNNKAEAEDEQ